MIKTNLAHRIKHTRLPKGKALLPMFEAVVNSIQAIQERRPTNPYIEVYIERDPILEGFDGKVDGFTIVDNGTGFNEANLDSFFTADTSYKATVGAKGVGRFLWLKTFSSIGIESHFTDNNTIKKRAFIFDADSEKPTAPALVSSELEPKTIVRLSGMKHPYKDACPRMLEVVAHRLVEHCFLFFLDPQCPIITIADDTNALHLNDYFAETFASKGSNHLFSVAGHEFRLRGFRLSRPRENQRHQLLYAADARIVQGVGLGKYRANLRRPLHDATGSAFVYMGFIEGAYLDETANDERTAFVFEEADADDDGGGDEVTLESITHLALDFVAKDLEPFLAGINAEKLKTFNSYIEEAPQYRWLSTHVSEFIDRIPPGATTRTLDLVLHEETYEAERRLKAEGRALYDDIEKQSLKPEQYEEKLSKFITEANELGKASLVQYVAHRKVILDFLEKSLQQNHTTEKYSLESIIHRIIYPMRSTSDEVPYAQQNLWIIDERLSYHSLLTSDLPLNETAQLCNTFASRPDLLIFERALGFAERGSDAALGSIMIVEFKKPERHSYKEDPIEQVYRLVRQVRSGHFKDRNGVEMKVESSIRAYAYIICDTTKEIEIFAEDKNMLKTPDGLGFYVYNDALRTYVEIISYRKLLFDAKKRNRVLFDMLRLPVN